MVGYGYLLTVAINLFLFETNQYIPSHKSILQTPFAVVSPLEACTGPHSVLLFVLFALSNL